MNSRHNSTSRLFLIFAFACAFLVSGTETQARTSDKGARLIVQRAPNFGTELVVHLSVDGREVADILRDHRYDGFVSAGRHVFDRACPAKHRVSPADVSACNRTVGPHLHIHRSVGSGSSCSPKINLVQPPVASGAS